MAISSQIISHRDVIGSPPLKSHIRYVQDEAETLIPSELLTLYKNGKENVEFQLDLSEKATDLRCIEAFISILQRCRKQKRLVYARRAHLLICSNGLDSDTTLGNFTVPMFVECGSIIDGERIFQKLSLRNEYSWTSIIQGYLECESFPDVIEILQMMRDDCVCPSKYTFVMLLKASSKFQCVDNGREIHTDIVNIGFEMDLFIGNTMIDLYAKCGFIEDARDVFDQLEFRDVVSWNALMAGYAELGYPNEVLNCLNNMKEGGVFGDAITFLSCLKACSNLGIIEKGLYVHLELVTEGCETDAFISSTLVGMYAKLGLLKEAQELFDELPTFDVISWTSLIMGYADHGLGEQALICIENMFQDGIYVDSLTLTCCLKVSGNVGTVDNIQEIHKRIIMDGFEEEPFLGSTLVSIYAKFGLFTEAWDLLKEVPDQDVVTWTALMTGYIDQGLPSEALECFEQMQSEGILPNMVTYICIVKACSKLRAMEKGEGVHAEITMKAIEGDLHLGNALVDMYTKCGLLSEARKVFHELHNHDIVSWNALIAGYAEQGFGNEVVSCFEQMEEEGTSPNAITFVCSLKDCVDLERGFQIHAIVAKEGFERHPILGNSLVDMYAKCGFLVEAQDVFDDLLVQDAISRTTLISAYADHMLHEEALNFMDQMKVDDISPDCVMFLCTLKACGVIGAIHRGQEIHSEAIQKGFENDHFIANTLVDMYVKCKLVADARSVFDNLSHRDIMSWTSIITGYVGYGLCDEALECLYEMQTEGLTPDVITWSAIILGYSERKESEKVFLLFSQMQEQCIIPNFVTLMSIMSICGHSAALEAGKRVHAEVHYIGRGVMGVNVATSLIEMYGRCGSMVEAHHLFEEMVDRDLMGWNALIAGYAREGSIKPLFNLLYKMMDEGKTPDEITFLNVYAVCNHGGLVSVGKSCFETISKEYGGVATTEHYNCMIDLFSRAGQFYETLRIFQEMPFQHDLVSWITLLSACRKWGYVEIGQKAFEIVVELYKDSGAAYILMSNVFMDGEE